MQKSIVLVMVIMLILVFYAASSVAHKIAPKIKVQRSNIECASLPQPICTKYNNITNKYETTSPTCSVTQDYSNKENPEQIEWICDYYQMPEETIEPRGLNIESSSIDESLNKCASTPYHRDSILTPACGWGSIGDKWMNYDDVGDNKKDVISGFAIMATNSDYKIFKRFLNIDASRVFGNRASGGPNNYEYESADSITECEALANTPYTFLSSDATRTINQHYGYVFYPSERRCKIYSLNSDTPVSTNIKFLREPSFNL